jgi:hydrogenase maturation protein HypF
MKLPQSMGGRVLALGAYLKNTACLLDGDQVQWSPLHGDLGTPEACAVLEASAASLLARADGRIDAVAHDLHPDFHSTRLAQQLAARLGVPAIAVQHHHAHIAAVQAEQGLVGPVLGLALDGVGLGTDGTAWGGELLRVDGGHAQRLAHLPALALPGGDIAAREPWRMAAAALHALGRADEIERRFAPAVGTQATRLLRRMLDRGLNCPTTTAAGRWFDAMAGLLGLSTRQAAEAEAAIALERAATAWLADHPAEPVPDVASLDLRLLLPSLMADADPGRAAARFHLGLAAALAQAATQAAQAHGITQVVLGGGCFFNRLLAEQVPARLRAAGLTAWLPRSLSCGDAGLALGQAWVAARTILPSPSQGEGQGGGRSDTSAAAHLTPTET